MQEKTYKREVAGVLLLFLGGLFIWGGWLPYAAEIAKYLTLPIFGFTGLAFGMDAYAKQIK